MNIFLDLVAGVFPNMTNTEFYLLSACLVAFHLMVFLLLFRWFWGKAFIMGALVVSLFFVSEARGQIAVIDVEANPINWVKQLAHMVTQIQDMIMQARLGHVSESGETGIYLQGQAEERYGDAVTYGSGGTELWPETFTFDEVWEDGMWLDSDLETERRALDTQRTMLRLLERKQEDFFHDEGVIGGVIEGVNGAGGRNEILPAMAKVNVEHLQQERKSQQLLMTIANALVVNNARQLNKEVKREAQERYFVEAGHVAFPEFRNLGL